MLHLWKISQEVNNEYDTFSDAVVVARDQESAKHIHPNGDWSLGESRYYYDDELEQWHPPDGPDFSDLSWAKPSDVTAVCIGQAADNLKENEVICASFHAG